jgi:type IV pilus assembly protein PilO
MPLKNKNALIAVFGSLALVVGVLYAFSSYIYKPVRQDIDKSNKEISDLKQKLTVAKERAQQLSKMQQEMASLQVDVAQLEKQLPKDRELPALIRVLTHRAETYGVTLDNLTPGKGISKGLYDEIPYNVSITTSFHNLGHFLTAMGKGDRLFAARNLALTPLNTKADPSKSIRATFQLIAFKYHG